MPFINAGQNLTNRIAFNSGFFDFGNSRVVQLNNLTFALEYTLAPLFMLGSIKPQFYMRHTQKVTVTGKIKSYAPELEMLIAGSSTLGGQNQVNTLDGQPTLLNPVLTMFDQNNKEIQYQLTSAIFKSMKMSAKVEDYPEYDFECEAIDAVELYTP